MLFLTAAVPSRVRVSFVTIAACILVCTPARPQDPLKVLPDAYKLEFENEHVRVVRVRYEPHAKLAAHDHPKGPTAYVYLNDGGPVVFKHIGLEYGDITRPATVAGGVRLARPVAEVHEVENPNDSPSEFLRVEFKDLSADAGQIRGRFLPEPHPPAENVSKVLFENGALLIKRRACVPAKPCDLGPPDNAPLLLVVLAKGRIKPRSADPVPLAAGDSQWLAAGTIWVVENRGESALEFLTFEFKPPQ
jgi:hypothetical protein